MQQRLDDATDHRERSEFIRGVVQKQPDHNRIPAKFVGKIPKSIIQFWDDSINPPADIQECVASWTHWQNSGFTHRLFDETEAKRFIGETLGARHLQAFARCYHPAMQSDYFRLCYLLVEGGCYVDADDVCLSVDISSLFDDGRLKLQPLCYDVALETMVEPSIFLCADAQNPNWIFYFNNNPIVACKQHPIIAHSLARATALLELADDGVLPEIQATTGPGNISKSIFEYVTTLGSQSEDDVVVLKNWNSIAVSRWPLSHREDARNWRLSNQKIFNRQRVRFE